MNRRNRTLIVVGLAVVLASLSSYLVYRAIQSIPVREVTIVERQTVVANQRIEAGSQLTTEMVRLQPWPMDAPVPGGFDAVDSVVGRGVTSAILPNEPVTESKLAGSGSGAGLPPMIPEGMLAMSIRVNEIVGVSGFVLAGTRVDVIAIASTNNSEPISRIVLNNIQVLAAGTETSAPEEGDAQPKTAVTVLVTPEDAEKLALAANQAQIVLALRNPLDTVAVETRGVRMSSLITPPAPAPVRSNVNGRTRVTTPPPPPVTPPYTVETIKGAQKDTQTLDVKRTSGGSQGSGS